MENVLTSLFGTAHALDDTSIQIRLPLEAAHPDSVPFRVVAPNAEKIAVFVMANDAPLSAVVTLHPGAGFMFQGTLSISNNSDIVFYALREKRLYRASRFLRLGFA